MASSNAESGVTRSKVRWHCWKARILFPILLLASSGMIWFGVRMHRASCQRAAVAAIKGGTASSIMTSRSTVRANLK